MPSPDKLLAALEKYRWEESSKQLAGAIEPHILDIVTNSAVSAGAGLNVKIDSDDPLIKRFVGRYALERATQLNDTTKESVAHIIRRAFEGAPEGATTKELADAIRDEVRKTFAGYAQWRADRIARTETAIGYNNGNVLGYAEAGVEKVRVMDGTLDDICSEANGQIWTLAESLADPIGHPNCERGFAAVVDAQSRGSLLKHLLSDTDVLLASISARVSELIAGLDDPCLDTRVLEPIDED